MILKHSAYVEKKSFVDSLKEVRYNIILAIFLFVSGILLFMIPFYSFNGLTILAESWILLLTIALTVIKPVIYFRGFTDISMGVLAGIFYFMLEFAFGYTAKNIENFHLIIAFTLFMLGLSRIIVYTQLMSKVRFSMLIISGIAEMISGGIIFMGSGRQSFATVYWIVGLTFILSAFAALQDAGKLRAKL